jgi:cytochrome c oxidase assembly factor CtaG
MWVNSRTKGLILAALLPAFVLTYWHLPQNFDLAVTDQGIHEIEHLSYLTIGGLVGLSVYAVPKKLRIMLLYIGFMQLGMMGSMMLVWPPGFYTIYSASQNVEMNTFMMLTGAAGVSILSYWVVKMLDII